MLTFAEAAHRAEAEVGAETHRLAAHGVTGMLIPATFEEGYYRQANLPEQLRRLGWSYLRVHSFELFTDPDAVADRIAGVLGAVTRGDTQPVPALPQP